MNRMIVCPKYFWDGISDTARRNCALVIEDGIVKKIVRADEAARMTGGNTAVLRNESWLLLPAFVDAHDHGRGVTPSSMSVPDQALEVWLQDLNKLAPIPHETACFFDGVRMAASGVGTVLHSHNPNSFADMAEELAAAERGYRAAGLRSILCPLYIDQNKRIYYGRDAFVSGLPEPLRSRFAAGIHDRIMTLDEYFALIEEVSERLEDDIRAGWTQIQLHPNGGQWCSDEALLAMKEYALARGMHVHLHLLETKYQAEYARRTWGKSFIAHYRDIGFLGPWVSFAHAVWLTDEDLQMIRESGAVLVNNASSNLRLRSGTFRLREVQDMDLTAGIGMDGCTIDDDQDFLREMRMAWLNNRQTGVDAGIDPHFILRMATSKGAKIAAQPLSEGILVPGHHADFVCLNLDRLYAPYTDPESDPLAMTVQRATRSCVDYTFVNGEQSFGTGEPWQTRETEAARRIRDCLIRLRKDGTWKRDNSEILRYVRDYYRKNCVEEGQRDA